MNENPFDDEDGGLLPELEEHRRVLPRWASSGVVAMAFVGFVGLAWYAYHASAPKMIEGDVLLVEADKTPMKVKPLDPGGMQFPNQDKTVFSALSGETDKAVERVVPMTEEPVKRGEVNANWVHEKLRQAEANAATTDAKEAIVATNNAKLIPSAGGEVLPAPANVNAANTTSPTTITSQDAPVTASAPATASVPAANAAPAVLPSVESVNVPTVPVATTSSAAPVELKPANKEVHKEVVKEAAKQAEAPAAKTVSEAVKTTAKTTAKEKPSKQKSVVLTQPKTKKGSSAPAASGGASIQLGAYKTDEEAKASWKHISTAHAALLSGLTPSVQRAAVPGKGVFYRLRVAVKDAKATCDKLTAEHQACIVTK